MSVGLFDKISIGNSLHTRSLLNSTKSSHIGWSPKLRTEERSLLPQTSHVVISCILLFI